MPVSIEVERSLLLPVPAEKAWSWMTDPSLELFEVNPFHLRARCESQLLAVGSEVEIGHRLGWREELRVARISKLSSYEIAWGETKAGGRDWFPHGQQFRLEPRGDGACRLNNRLRGTFHLPGARWWLWSWYRWILPRVLDLENRRIATGVAAHP